MTKTTQYLYCEKVDVLDQCREEGITDDGKLHNVIGAIYEVEFEIDADTGDILKVISGRQTFKKGA